MPVLKEQHYFSSLLNTPISFLVMLFGKKIHHIQFQENAAKNKIVYSDAIIVCVCLL